MKPPAHHALATDQQQREQHRCLHQRDRDCLRQHARFCVERRHDNEEGNDCKILKQQHADDTFAVLGVELHALGQYLHYDRR